MSDMQTVRTAECHCLNCNRLLDAVSDIGMGKDPSEGDLALCVYCGAVMILAQDLTPRAFTKEEAERLIANRKAMTQIFCAVRTCNLVIASRN
jgi:hypothetical protein